MGDYEFPDEEYEPGALPGQSSKYPEAPLKKGRKPYTRFNRERRNKFLDALRQTGNVTAACEAAYVDRRTAYREKKSNAEFSRAWDEALEIAIEGMELEARRRAVEGRDEPVFGRIAKDRDGVVGHIRKYSDVLLIFLLKAHKPAIYRETVNLKHSGAISHPQTDLTKLTDDDLDQLETLLSKAADPDGASADSG